MVVCLVCDEECNLVCGAEWREMTALIESEGLVIPIHSYSIIQHCQSLVSQSVTLFKQFRLCMRRTARTSTGVNVSALPTRLWCFCGALVCSIRLFCLGDSRVTIS